MRRNDRYAGDVAYEVWRHGGNPDAVDRDRMADYYYGGLSADEAAHAELHRQRPQSRSRSRSHERPHA